MQAAIRATVQQFGALHVLHNNAGGSTPQDNTVVDAPIEEFWRVIRLDLFGTFLGCRFGIPAIIRSGGGSVINMSSNVALMGIRRARLLHRREGRRRGDDPLDGGGIRAAARAGQRHRAVGHDDRARAQAGGRQCRPDKLADSHLLGLIEPEDIANMALFLASDESRMVTGQVYPVDSGVTIS